jgi:hypothetical protein
MNRTRLLAFVLMSLMACCATAAEPAAAEKPGPGDKALPTAAVEPSQPVIPKRELRFDRSEEERAMELFAADPKLLEMRYVATFRCQMETGFTSSGMEELGGVGKLCLLLVNGRTGSDFFKSLVKNVPPGRLPSKEVVLALTKQSDCRVVSKDFDLKPITREIPQTSGPPRRVSGMMAHVFQIEVFASTAEQAQELAQGILSLFDYGLSYPAQVKPLSDLDSRKESLLAKRADLSKVEEQLKALNEQLEQFKDVEDISDETLSGLVTQQRLIAVDTEGVKARIAACNKLFPKEPTPRQKIESIENLKLNAEIELAGLEARRNALKEIVDKAQQRKQLGKRILEIDHTLSRTRSEVSGMVGNINSATAVWMTFLPFPVEDDKVEIRRIKWESKRK